MWRGQISAVARGACTLLSAVVVAGWVGSRRGNLSVWHKRPSMVAQFQLCSGSACVSWERGNGRILAIGQLEWDLRLEDNWRGQWLGNWWKPEWSKRPELSWITIPLYLPLALTLAPAAFLWWHEIRRRCLVGVGVCKGCGYDRRGLATLQTLCPECGAVPEPNGRPPIAQGASP